MKVLKILSRHRFLCYALCFALPVAVVLDATPLGLLTQKKGVPEVGACRTWYQTLINFGCLLFVPEIADYELRREFLRQGNGGAVSRLQIFNVATPDRYLPLTTAPPEALDADALIAAQTSLLNPAASGLAATVVATANVGHLSAPTNAILWSNIRL